MPGMAKVKDIALWDQAMQAEPAEAIPDGLPGAWWVAHTRPRNEKALALDLRALDIFSYLPLHRHETRSRSTGRISRSIVPVFTGYLFFNGTEEQRSLALTTNRVAKTLAVPDQLELVQHLRQVQQVLGTGTQFQWQGSLQVGDWARVVAGPLTGTEGVVYQRLSELRLALNVQMLGQAISIEVSREMIEKIDPPT
jgi:transcriptional antiterminator RfaH